MIGDVVSLLQDLVRIPSVNPKGHQGADCSDLGEERLARHVAGLLRGMGAETRLEEIEPKRPNVVGRFPCRATPDRRVLFAPHLDTVGVAGMSVDPFGGDVENGRLYGRGASDTKGSMAAMLQALWEVKDLLGKGSTEITFVAFMGEEFGQNGSRSFARANQGKYDFAVVGEPTSCQVVHAHKGSTQMELAVRGKSAHASRPERGDNAIVKAARVIQALDGPFRAFLADRYEDPVLGCPTLNPGLVAGGTMANIVPDRATLTLDMRLTPALEAADPCLVLSRFLHETLPDVEVTLMQPYACGAMHTPLEHPMLQLLLESTGASAVTAPWFCDAAHLAAAGIPSVAAGPGSIEQAHTADEWIALDELERGVRFYRKFLDALIA